MTMSLNGWPGISVSGPLLATGTVPGTSRKVTLRRDVLPLFLAFLADWHREVMPIDGQRTYLGPDGWVYRDARTGAGLSNHASGTAVDVRYDVLKADHQRHMSAAQIAAVHRLLDKYVDVNGRRVFGWGGDWTVGSYCDEMHTELAQSWATGAHGRGTISQDVTNVIARLGIRPDGTTRAPVSPPPPAPVGRPSASWVPGDDLTAAWAAYLRRHPLLYVAGNRSTRINAQGYRSLCGLRSAPKAPAPFHGPYAAPTTGPVVVTMRQALGLPVQA